MKIIVILFLFLSALSFGQSEMDQWLEVKGKAGFLIAHRASMGHMAQEHAYAAEISYMFQPNNQQDWHSNFRNPLYGATFFAGTVGSRQYLGSFYGGYGFVRFPFVKYQKYVLSGKLGVGMGYGTKVYDPETNILNVAISSHLNAMICLGLNSRYVFGNNAITLEADMTHFSNGSTKVPNLGINVPYLSLGYSRKIIEKQLDTVINDLADVMNKRFEFGVMAVGSVQEIYPFLGEKYPFFGMNFFARRFFGGKSAMEVSFDVFSKQSIRGYQPDLEKSQLDIIQLGVYAGYIIPLNQLHVLIGMGVYVRDKYKPADPMYHRLAIRYILKNGINFNMALKSHWARADYVEYGIGYSFKR